MDNMVITNKEIKCIRAIVAVLKEFAGATVFLQGQNYITISHVPRLITFILDSLVVNEDLDNKTVRQLKIDLEREGHKYFYQILDEPSVCNMAAALDPLTARLSEFSPSVKEKIRSTILRGYEIFNENEENAGEQQNQTHPRPITQSAFFYLKKKEEERRRAG